MSPSEPSSPTGVRLAGAVVVVLAVVVAIPARRVEQHGLDLA